MIRIKRNKEKIVRAALLLITVISLGVTVYTLILNKDEKVLAPDYAKPEIEENAEPFGNQNEDKYEKSENGSGTVDIIYEKKVEIDLSDNKVYLMFGNPQKSNHDMMIQIIVKDLLVSESGMILAGNRVNELQLKSTVNERLISGQYEGEILVSFYDCVTAEKAMVDVTIPILIAVNE